MDFDVHVAEHLIASTRGRIRSLTRPEQASWLWAHLQQALGPIFSLMLMPDHLHLVAAPGQRMVLTRVLAAFTVRFGVRFDVREPEVAHNADIAGRMMRYGFFNPVRARLVDDPWRWQWSTLRDLGGAAYPCWTPLDRVAAFLERSPSSAMRGLTTLGNHHGPPPCLRSVTIASIEGVRAAVAATLRVPASEVDALPSDAS
jgi:hypothetical protein